MASRVNADSFQNSTTGLGGGSDKARTLSVVNPGSLSFSQLDILVRKNGYVHRWCHFPAEEMTRRGWMPVYHRPDVKADGIIPKAQPADLLWEAGERVGVTRAFHEAVWKSRAHGAAFVFADVLCAPEHADLSLPLPPVVGPVLSLHVFDADEARAELYDWKGVPTHYRVTPTRRTSLGQPARDPFQNASVLVHRSRMAVVVGEPISNTARASHWTEGEAAVEHVLRAVQNLSQTDDAGAVLAQEFRVDVLKTSIDSSGPSDAGSTFAARVKLIAAAKGLLNMIVTTKDEEFETHTPTLSGWKDLTEAQRASLAAQCGWPQAILFGDAAQGMNVDSSAARTELNNWTAARQGLVLREPLVQVYDILARSAFGPYEGRPPLARLDVKFHDLEQLSATQRAAIRLSHTQADVALLGQGVLEANDARARYATGEFEERLPALAPLPPALPGAPEAPTPPTGGGTPGLERGPARALLGGRPDLPASNTPALLDGGQGATGAAGGHVQKAGRGEGVEANADARDSEDPLATRYAIPDGAISNAKRVLRWREEHRGEIRGMTATGWARARQLAAGGTIGRGDLIEIAAWFARHGKAGTSAAPENPDKPWTDPGHVAWLGWGGDTMASWAAERRAALED